MNGNFQYFRSITTMKMCSLSRCNCLWYIVITNSRTICIFILCLICVSMFSIRVFSIWYHELNPASNIVTFFKNWRGVKVAELRIQHKPVSFTLKPFFMKLSLYSQWHFEFFYLFYKCFLLTYTYSIIQKLNQRDFIVTIFISEQPFPLLTRQIMSAFNPNDYNFFCLYWYLHLMLYNFFYFYNCYLSEITGLI